MARESSCQYLRQVRSRAVIAHKARELMKHPLVHQLVRQIQIVRDQRRQQLRRAERFGHLRGASRFGPNGLKLEKETTHDLV